MIPSSSSATVLFPLLPPRSFFLKAKGSIHNVRAERGGGRDLSSEVKRLDDSSEKGGMNETEEEGAGR